MALSFVPIAHSIVGGVRGRHPFKVTRRGAILLELVDYPPRLVLPLERSFAFASSAVTYINHMAESLTQLGGGAPHRRTTYADWPLLVAVTDRHRHAPETLIIESHTYYPVLPHLFQEFPSPPIDRLLSSFLSVCL